MSAEVSRALARLKNYWNLPPGEELDRLIVAGDTIERIEDLPRWIRNGLREMESKG